MRISLDAWKSPSPADAAGAMRMGGLVKLFIGLSASCKLTMVCLLGRAEFQCSGPVNQGHERQVVTPHESPFLVRRGFRSGHHRDARTKRDRRWVTPNHDGGPWW